MQNRDFPRKSQFDTNPIRILVTLAIAANVFGADQSFDVVVYGGTAGGSIAAIAAAKEGARTALVEPGRHVGGMITGGLGRTDMDRQENVIGGLSREFFERVGRHYGQPVSWVFEPSVAEEVMNDWLREAGVHVYFSQRISGVLKTANRITGVSTAQGGRFTAPVYIDASYEGDLMKAAGVSYVVGREGREQYGESLAGRQDILPGRHQFRVGVEATDPQGKLLPLLQPQDTIERTGEGSRKFQSYCFRICLTRNPANRMPIPPPQKYDPGRYQLARSYIAALGDSVTLGDFLGISALPNDKSDINSTGAVSTNLPGASWDYPDGDLRRRQDIWDQHLTWAQGLLYFLGHDEAVPESIRKQMNDWGLARDEFLDTGHWPRQLYVREGRRMLGEYVLTQYDLQDNREKYDSIGMAGYNIDIREVQWIGRDVYHFPTVRKEVLMEGYVSMPVQPWQIPYRALLPKQGECGNLLVISTISASTVAYASFRMEPQYMIAGHAAGVAAAQTARTGIALHRINLDQLQRRLRDQKQIISM